MNGDFKMSINSTEHWKKVTEKISDEEPPEWAGPNTQEYIQYYMKKWIKYEVKDGILYITLSRPEKLNAGLPYPAAEACLVARDDPEVRVIVLKGLGRAFCAGYDVSPRPPKPGAPKPGEVSIAERWALRKYEESMSEFYHRRLWENPKPIIGSVHGFCLAGGCNLLAHADLIIASEDSLFGYPPTRWGTLGVQTLMPLYFGLRKSKELLMTGNMITATEAYNFGWLNKVVAREDLEKETDLLAHAIKSIPKTNVSLVKRFLNNIWEQLGMTNAQLSFAELIRGVAGTYRVETERGTGAWWNKTREELGLANALRERDKPFVEVDRWWRERFAKGKQSRR
jgi:enoyl-CoA hydratase